jgi:hypothetical protein
LPQSEFAAVRQQNPYLVFVRLHPESAHDKKLLDENRDLETIELYYHSTVNEKLPGYVVMKIIKGGLWPHLADLIVQKVIGIG